MSSSGTLGGIGRRLGLRRAVLATVALVLVSSACGISDSSADGPSVTNTTTDGPTATHTTTDGPPHDEEWRRSTIEDAHLSLSFLIPVHWGLSGVIDGEGTGSSDPSDKACVDIVRADLGELQLQAVPAGCQVDNAKPGNGSHGVYRTLDDVPEPLDVTVVDTPAGPAEVFHQAYFECTNSCQDFTDRVAIVTLDHPVDPEFPTVVLRSDKSKVHPSTFRAVLNGMTDG